MLVVWVGVGVKMPAYVWAVGLIIVARGVAVVGVVLVSSLSSMSMPATGRNCGPSLCFLGTGLIVYHLFLLLMAIYTHRQSSSI